MKSKKLNVYDLTTDWRLIKPNYTADPFLNDVMQTVVLGKDSICQLIENSDAFKDIFNSQVQRIEDSPVRGDRVRDMQASKIRFASSQKPLARAVIFLDAVWSTIEIIWTTKDGKKPKPVTHLNDKQQNLLWFSNRGKQTLLGRTRTHVDHTRKPPFERTST